ncbi:diuretic hormone receptor-like [Mizuhopecten yessoensis]|uniref:Calcitonin receptor n=1 Tax=Mizuhopecten yessoensis TaxID=6573 RepID=A0A210R1W7_MIZYE|nr:diuretic hormone receptor-like [Mizuhopecten yessoensis]XP_021376501.1 diuretic hormone receptor-like [Mizuhopecten yessoensis]XP_021376509.1 diuretic hormone receptor-like [Mizuhopecten yessoensis]XP_021376516.1 diuretic hormone receptor-like [Mizuhopecten yessoensis]XP_021376524.1 diuretic hormone receptor-like [Mizuhopecten yessoensis]XP_021376533.1 diuretic hormone receptor-like [Mizuhopecten yessoensis]OWF55028.1 Calcitonin receptor [Mizuhopecten yessoensis]
MADNSAPLKNIAGPENNTSSGNYSVFHEPDLTLLESIRQCQESSAKIELHAGVTYCPHEYDGILCWMTSPTDSFASVKCPTAYEGHPIPDHILATRYCNTTGLWEETTNYSQCLAFYKTIQNSGEADQNTHLWMIVRDIYFVCSILSLVFLIVTLFIFSYFRALQCSRIAIHKNLVVSFIIRFVVLIVMIEPLVTGRATSYQDLEWLCKLFQVLNQYTALANIYWMFVEGLFLHNSIVVSVFSTEAPFKLFFFIGWGFPALVIVTWAIVMHFENANSCWGNYSQMPFIYIIIVPFLAALIINLLFLINIIRILVKKLRANNTIESDRIRRAIKATIVLMPLLGLTNILFVYNPEDGGGLQSAYHITNAVLQSIQGIMVSIFYCFLNGEVRRVIKRKWYRFKIRRFLQSGGRRRSSRTSSFILSQTEVQDLNEMASLTTKANMAAGHDEPDLVDVRETTVDQERRESVTDQGPETTQSVPIGNHVIPDVWNHANGVDLSQSFDSDEVISPKEVSDYMEEAYTEILDSFPPANDTLSDIDNSETDNLKEDNEFNWSKSPNENPSKHDGTCIVNLTSNPESSQYPLSNGHSQHRPWSVSESSDISAGASTHNTDSPNPSTCSNAPLLTTQQTGRDENDNSHVTKPETPICADYNGDWDEIFAICDTFDHDTRTESTS